MGEIARIFGRKGKCQVGSFCLFFISVLVLDKESCSKVLVAISVRDKDFQPLIIAVEDEVVDLI